MKYIPLKTGLYVPAAQVARAKELTDCPVYADDRLMPDDWYIVTDDDSRIVDHANNPLSRVLKEALDQALDPCPEVKMGIGPCPDCGATTEKDAETMCKPRVAPDGEWFCAGVFDARGNSMVETPESLRALDEWCERQPRSSEGASSVVLDQDAEANAACPQNAGCGEGKG